MPAIFGVDQIELNLGEWGTLLYAKWQHPSEQNLSPISEEEMDFWGRLIPEGSYVIDVGAYVGAVSLAMALAAGPTGLCLSFEPNPSTFKVLQTNAEWNDVNILPLQLAIGTRFEQKTFHYTDQGYCNGGDMSYIESGIGTQCNHVPLVVQTVPLTPFLSRHPAFVKVDTEGSDRMVLEQLAPLFKEGLRVRFEVYPDLTAMERRMLRNTIPPHYEVWVDGIDAYAAPAGQNLLKDEMVRRGARLWNPEL